MVCFSREKYTTYTDDHGQKVMSNYKKILKICISHRKNGNSAILLNTVLGLARSGGHGVELLTPGKFKILPCRGCFSCSRSYTCVPTVDLKRIKAWIEAEDRLICPNCLSNAFQADLEVSPDALEWDDDPLGALKAVIPTDLETVIKKLVTQKAVQKGAHSGHPRHRKAIFA